MKGFQKKYLKGLAHGLKPVVLVGRQGLMPGVIQAIGEALLAHELIKIKFNDFKEKERKSALTQHIERETGAEMVGMIGHMAIFYRRRPSPEKPGIVLPER